ncbi:glutathione S-transferase family protein [uncultured Litoreibacter sp.]|uniref:glutathione S-transferase family protein n=1 Tax=uncultured Litoreibacter sp. TaxID=1392394 RepID=UPI00262C5D35|nr:glutathione S-transferase family protein [uncultured Litoreibacter sp.]
MIRLHHAHQTRSMRSLWLLNELGVEFETVVHPFGKNLRAPDYLAKHPVGRVPALEIDGKVLFETGAIAEYLCDRFPQAGLGRVAGDEDRADWLIWLHFAETVAQHCASLTQQHVMLYEPEMRSDIIMKLEAARLGKCFGALDQRLEGRDYLLDSGFSAVDISCGYAVYSGVHYVRPDAYPNLVAWYDRLSARPGFQASLPPEGEGIYQQDFYPAPQ